MASKVESEIEVAAPKVSDDAEEAKTEEMDTTEEAAATAAAEEEAGFTPIEKPIKYRQMFVGNPPLVNTEEVLRKKFVEYGEIQNFQTYEFAGSLIAIITYVDQESTKKAVDLDTQVLEGHRLRVHCAGKLPNGLPTGFMVVAVEDDASLTEDALMTKYSKYGELIQVNKIFPHVYLHFKDKADKTSALEKCKADNLKLYAIRDVSDVNQHLELIKEQRQFHLNVNKVHIANLAASTTEEEVKTLCSKFGDVKVSNTVFEYGNKAHTSTVYFNSEEIAKTATAELNGFMHNGRRLRALHNITHVIPNYKTSIYITGLKPDTTEEQIYEDFSQYGDIDYVTRMNLKPECILIVYKDEDSVNKAVAAKVFTRKLADTTETFTNITIAKFDGPLTDPVISMKRKRVFEDGKNETSQREVNKFFVKPGSLSTLFPLYVSNIPGKINKSALINCFEKKGVIKIIVFMPSEKYAKAMDPPAKIAIIYFNSANDAENSRAFIDQKMFHGKRLHVVNARKAAPLAKDRTVYVSDLNPKITEEMLHEHFEKIGTIERVVRSLDNDAFVCFKSKDDKAKVLGPNVDLKIDDCSFRVAPARKDFDVKLVKENSSLLEEKLIALQTSMKMAKRSGKPLRGGCPHMYLLTGRKEHLTKASFTDEAMSYNKKMRFNNNRGGSDRGYGNNMSGNNYGGGYRGNNDNYSNRNQGGGGGIDSGNIEKLLQLAFMSGKNLGEMSSRNDMLPNSMLSQMSRNPEPLIGGGGRFNDLAMPSNRNENLGSMFGGGNFDSFGSDNLSSRNGGNNNFGNFSQSGNSRFDDFGSDNFGRNDNSNSFGRNNDSFGRNNDSFGRNNDSFGRNNDNFGRNNDNFGRNQNQSMGRNQNSQSIGQKRDSMGYPKNQSNNRNNTNQRNAGNNRNNNGNNNRGNSNFGGRNNSFGNNDMGIDVWENSSSRNNNNSMGGGGSFGRRF